MMLDLLIASISSPWQYSESKQPLDAVTEYVSKTILGDIDNLRGSNKVNHTQLHRASPSYHNECKADLMAGKSNLGAFALSNSHHMLAQATGLTYKTKKQNKTLKKYGILRLDKIHSDEPNYWDINKLDKNGEVREREDKIQIFTLISDWLSAMVNAHVDVAKDAYINRLNVRKLTLNTVNMLLRAGKGESTFYFMAQDILVKFADEYEKYRGFYGVNLYGKSPEATAYESVLKQYIDKYNELKSSKEQAINSESFLSEELPESTASLVFDIPTLRSNMAPRNDAAWYKFQLDILKAYKELEPAARSLSKSVTTSQIDTKKFGNNFSLQQNFLLKLLSFINDDGMFQDPSSIIKDSFLREKLIRGVLEPREYFSSILLRVNPLFEDLRNKIYSMLGSPEYLQQRSINNITRMMEAAYKQKFFIEYAAKNGIDLEGLFYNKKSKDKDGNEIYTFSLPYRLSMLKRKIRINANGEYNSLIGSDGIFQNALLDNIDEIPRYTKDEKRLPPFISFRPNKDDDHNLDDHIIRAWEELLDSDIPEVSTFARDLAVYAMLTSGDGFGTNNIFKYVPNSFRESCGYFDYIRSLESDPTKMVNNINIDIVLRNLWWDDNIVKPIPYVMEGYDETGVPIKYNRKSRISSNDSFVIVKNNKGEYRQIAVPIEIHVPEVKPVTEINGMPFYPPYVKMRLGGMNDPLTTLLYKYAGYEVNTKTNKNEAIYHVVEKRGMNYKGKTLVDFSSGANLIVPSRISYKSRSTITGGYTQFNWSSINQISNPFGIYTNDLKYKLGIIGVDDLANIPEVGNTIWNVPYRKGDPQKYPMVDFVYTENAQAYQAVHGRNGTNYSYPMPKEVKINVSDTGKDGAPNQAGIRTDRRGNISENAYGIIVKKYQQDENGNFVKEEGQFKDTDEDFEMFKLLNDEVFTSLLNSSNDRKAFPPTIAKGKAALPMRFAEWLQESLKTRFGLDYKIEENNTEGYNGYGLVYQGIATETMDISNASSPEIIKEDKSTYTNSFTFKDGTIVKTKFELNEQQKKALWSLEEFYESKDFNDVAFTLVGYAGTGKTTIMSVFDEWLKTKGKTPIYVAPTHRANAVTKMNNPSVTAVTLHNLLGLRPTESLNDVKKVEFKPVEGKTIENQVLIIDECSMIGDKLYDMLLNACKQPGNNNKIIFLGDPAQLKPVKGEGLSKVFAAATNKSELTKVERTGDNAILTEATRIRNGESVTYKTNINSKGQGVQYVDIGSGNVITYIEPLLTDDRYKDNPLFFKMLAYTNEEVAKLNSIARGKLYGGKAPMLKSGEIITSYNNEKYDSNTKKYGIMNSVDYQIFEISRLDKKDLGYGIIVSGYNVTLMNAFDKSLIKDVFILDKTQNIDLIRNKIKAFNSDINRYDSTGNQKMAAKTRREREAFMNSFYTFDDIKDDYGRRVLKSKTFDYGYAQTIHKSQGGTYDNVAIFEYDIETSKDQQNVKQLKYVAMSRAKNKVIYVTQGKDIVTENTAVTESEDSNSIADLSEKGIQRKNICNNK